ncbi:TIGR02594 family protein [Bradyrhizobium sp. dw_78]|uniref:TIGR02594 family protein n=1 Tax=Bradyrhizobium sp. dw_78 TaxID=2719793 RepID=UPI001BD6B8F9|nr:TIGR02594 family protein [Bradyrhizobium sp. dw_78]
MIQLFAFRRSRRAVSFGFVAAALCTASMVVSVTPASARSHHGIVRHGHARYAFHHTRRHFAYRHYRHFARLSHRDSGIEPMPMGGFDDANAGFASGSPAFSGGFGSSNLVAEARRYLGGNPTSRSTLWCARFMNFVLERSGHRGTGSDMASSFAHYGQRVSGPQVGAIAVMSRHGGGHVGVVSGIDGNGNPIVVSGNYGHRVAEASISRSRIYAYVVPTT